MPLFFFPALECRTKPLNIALENSVMAAESMILNRIIHSSAPFHLLSEEITTFAQG